MFVAANTQPDYTVIDSTSFDNKVEGYNVLYQTVLTNLLNQQEKAQNKNFTLGGDHSIAAGTIAASLDVYKDDLVVVWVDAHADINTIASSTTGNYHGMPLGSLMHLMTPWVKHVPALMPSQLIYIGIRDLDTFELDLLANTPAIMAITMADIQKNGFEHELKRIYKRLSNKYVHFSFDIDSLDPSAAPSTGTCVDSGLSVSNVLSIIDAISTANAKIVNVDITEFNPYIGTACDVSTTTQSIQTIVSRLLE
jgi:arginase